MKRWQVLLLVIMALLATLLFCGVLAVSRAVFSTSPINVTTEANAQAETNVVATRIAQATHTPTPTRTPTATATDTPVPTATNTRVVLDTATPTPSRTPTPGPTATNTLVVPSSGYSSGGNHPAPTATSRYPYRITKGPVAYSTTNYFFVILAQVISGGVPQPGYKLKGTFSPSGFNFESPPSCPDLCKASGVEAITDDNGNVTYFGVQKGNLVFEAPIYETGTWSVMLVDPNGQQASEILTIETNIDDRQWFYYEFTR